MKQEDGIINKRYTIAARFIYTSALIGTINTLLSFNIFTKQDWIISFVSIAVIVIIGLLIGKGYTWIKYVLAGLILIGLSGFSYIIQDIKEYPINGVLSLSISILQIIATIILFIKKKPASQ